MKRALLFLLMLFFVGRLPSQAQDDPWLAVNSLLDQAEASLENGDLVVAQGLMNGAALLLSDEVVAECDGGLGARALLQQAATAADVQTAQALLSSARTLLADCTGDTPTAADVPDLANLEPVTSNTDWTPVIQEFDGFEMVLVPPGCFMMGRDDGGASERPVHEVCIEEAFWIDVYEVTNEQYGGPLDSPACLEISEAPEQPRNCVNWFDAQAFCSARDGSLPSEAQWEYAARGPESWVYPWGNDFVSEYVVYVDNSGGRTAAVGSRPGGVSWVGAYDMLGNVSEWTTTIYDQARFPYPYSLTDDRDRVNRDNSLDRVTRGGSVLVASVESLRGALRSWSDSGFGRSQGIGFRCVRSDEGTVATEDAPQTTEDVTTSDVGEAEQDSGSDTAQITRVTANTDWTPVIQEFDGVQMALVPPGCFMMGSEDGNDNEQPVHEQCFDAPFWIDQTEVTQADFERLGGVKARDNGFDGDQLPVETITWFEAQDFCALRAARLPTEAEWEYAARGPDALVYPWGNSWNEIDNNAVWDGNSSGQTANVGSRPAGASWVGAFDLIGNVWEWTSFLDRVYPYNADGREEDVNTINVRVARGGSWGSFFIDDLRAPNRVYVAADNDNSYYGFRCVRSG